MSWKSSIMVQRSEFVRLASVEGQEFSEACSRFGISRKTGYKWMNRFREEGESGLADRSRRPKKSPDKSSKKTESMVVKLREKHPRWGGRKLRQRLLDLDRRNVPSASTITSILGRHGLLSEVDGAGEQLTVQRFERESPNELWQMDFKGHFAMVGGGRCHPLTVLDDHSRYSIGIRACDNEQACTVMSELVTMFRQYGLPVQMLMDNGSPWGDCGGQSWTIVTSWLVRLGIRVSHIRPHHPQTQGKDERFHRTLKAEVLRDRSHLDLSACQRDFDPWREIYNRERPHESIGMKVPASRYRLSERRYPEVLPSVEYGSEADVRRVQTNSVIRFRGHTIRIGKAFIGQPVGLLPSQTDGFYEVFYCHQRIGWIDLRQAEANPKRNLTMLRDLDK
jgi:transposase InsO family protein